MNNISRERTVSRVSRTNHVPSVNQAMLVLKAFVRIVACIPSLCPMSIADVPMERIPFYKYTIYATEHRDVWDPALVMRMRECVNYCHRSHIHLEHFIDHAHLEWHCIYAPISKRDCSFLVCRLVLSNSHLVLSNSQMPDPSSWQHLHTNPRIDLFYQFFRWQSVTKIYKHS